MVDGHDVEELCKALWHAEQTKGKPTAIVAKTFKGKGLKGDYLYSILQDQHYINDICYSDCPHSHGLTCDLCSGIEDQDNWHGKPIPKDCVEELINHILSQIQSPNKPLHPQLPNEDAAPADLTPISLLTAPEYKIGDKVMNCHCRCWSF